MNMRLLAIIALILGTVAILLHQPPMVWRVITGLLFGGSVSLLFQKSRKADTTVALIGLTGLVIGAVLG